MQEKKERQNQKNKKKFGRELAPLRCFCPAVLVVGVVLWTLTVNQPVLQEIPSLLTVQAQTAQSITENNLSKGQEVQQATDDTAATSTEETNTVSAAVDSTQQQEESTIQKSTLATSQDGYQDGTYTGQAQGFGGKIQVEVKIENKKIISIQIVQADNETPSYLTQAKAVIERIIAQQSTNVDAVSGATYSSVGIINAVTQALNKALPKSSSQKQETTTANVQTQEVTKSTKKETQSETTSRQDRETEAEKVTTAAETDKSSYENGTYTGSADGFGGEIEVQVKIAKGKISSIKILQADDETPSYLKQAKAVIQKILKKQSTNVDVVSGATYSSEGIINAVAQALQKALKKETSETSTQDSSKATESEKRTESVKPTQSTKPTATTKETTKAQKEESKPSDSGSTEKQTEATTEESTQVPITTTYADGVYQATSTCSYGTVFDYLVQATVTVADGKITDISVERLQDSGNNDIYMRYAINGRRRNGKVYKGIPSQIMENQSTDGVDSVSGATYSSKAITKAVTQALEQALVQEKQARSLETPAQQEGKSTQENEG